MKHRGLWVFSGFESAELSTLSTKSASEKLESQVVNLDAKS
ncbi:conserved hypothetical protein [Vibrio mimicus MB451]|nr:conserved hypothetical protein [Vibrio mimicus MB451]EEY36899.1 conserved hypothetical protein [Vibrio mimicus MB451]EEY36947.1 conserved hypothetical protein [Vibrio mimicus MB451]